MYSKAINLIGHLDGNKDHTVYDIYVDSLGMNITHKHNRKFRDTVCKVTELLAG